MLESRPREVAPMSKPAEYRENAALCLEAMRAAEVPEVKESLQTLARRWIDLADRVEQTGGCEGREMDR
jgi:hypothetical protein